MVKHTCIEKPNTYVYNILTCGFHQTIKIKLFTYETIIGLVFNNIRIA